MCIHILQSVPLCSEKTTYVGYTAAELLFTRNPTIDVVADCLAAPRRNFEADSAAPWQRAPPLDHVQVAAMRAAWHEWCPPLRAPRGGDATPFSSHDVMLLT